MAPIISSRAHCAVLLMATCFAEEGRTSQVGKRHNDVEHRIEKARAQITALSPVARRREATMCASDYNLCPASVNGDCCPQSYKCEADACYATTAGTAASACGKAGFYDCPVSLGGGCCPKGFVCGERVCYPPAGASTMSTSCPVNYYLCPASLYLGCCQSGLECGANTCYITTPSPATYTKTVTTTMEGGEAVTSTTTVTTTMSPRLPTGAPVTSNAVAKLIPTKVDKVLATSSPEPGIGGAGLTKAQLGGIIGSAMVVLLVIIITALIIIRRLNRVSAETATADVRSTDDDPNKSRRAQMAQYQHGPSSSLSDDPLIFSTPGQSTMDTPHEIAADLDLSPAPMTPAYLSDTPSQDMLHLTMDSSQGYFDIPARISNIPGGVRESLRTSTDSSGNVQQYYHQHVHQYSNTSDISATSSGDGHHVGSPLIPAELEVTGGFIPELPVDEDRTIVNRRRSGSSTIASSRASVTQGRRYTAAYMGNPVTSNRQQQQQQQALGS